MNATLRRLIGPVLGLAVAATTGCGEGPTPDAGPIAPDASATAADPAAGKESAAIEPIDVTTISLSAEQMENIKGLPEADQALALEQKVCPSTGEKLGSMGVPIKVDVKGQPVFLCCNGCKEDVQKKPDTVLAKLGKKPAEAATEAEPAVTP